MNKNDLLVGINKYCKTKHTMNDGNITFLVKNYRRFSCSVLGQDYVILKNCQNFYYQNWLLKE